MKKVIMYLAIIAVILVIFFVLKGASPMSPKTGDQEYSPKIDSKDFISSINNPFYTLVPGQTFTYKGKTANGVEKNTTIVTNKTKNILGVATVEVWDRVWLNDSLIEETYDWYAQDKDGNVWYFGEDSKEYEDGRVTSTKGSWEGGMNGALPGIIMKAHPAVGDSYRQEYFKGEAEDMADVLSVTEKVTTPLGTFSNCLKTHDWSKVDSNLNEHKYYCVPIGAVILEVDVDSGAKTELLSVSNK